MADKDLKLSNVSYFLGALAHGAEQNLGKGSFSFGFLAGKKFGAQATQGIEQSADPEKAVAILRKALERQGIWWDFEPFKGEGQMVADLIPTFGSVKMIGGELDRIRAARARQVSSRRRTIVGTTVYPNLKEQRLADVRMAAGDAQGAADARARAEAL